MRENNFNSGAATTATFVGKIVQQRRTSFDVQILFYSSNGDTNRVES